MNRKQLTMFLILLAGYALCAFATYAFFIDELTASMGIPSFNGRTTPLYGSPTSSPRLHNWRWASRHLSSS
ncbi:hypothetical protein [Candidatus Villigracilis affinis]|uniref:hypothetical protein n=1 Tax=Candidatus Villigracilis affinis TaxID=3140682 RepID=UPI001DF226B1|nr:hypothetical protein [Anaerolineales bacterium]